MHSSILPEPLPFESDGYVRIEQAIAYLRAAQPRQPELPEIAQHIGLSASHTQRLFSRWAGISPKRFAQFLTVERAKRCMDETADLLGLALAAGLSGPGRLHDLFVTMEAMSPGEFRQAAAGMTIHYGTGLTPFGEALVAISPRGVCHLSFRQGEPHKESAAALRRTWPQAVLVHAPEAAAETLEGIFARAPGSPQRGLSLWVSGSNFQIQVWRALLQLPFAGLLSYGRLAEFIDRPGAARAVGSAVARNPVGYLIPCHRVLRESGDFGDYRWGGQRKAAICAWEVAQGDRLAPPV